MSVVVLNIYFSLDKLRFYARLFKTRSKQNVLSQNNVVRKLILIITQFITYLHRTHITCNTYNIEFHRA